MLCMLQDDTVKLVKIDPDAPMLTAAQIAAAAAAAAASSAAAAATAAPAASPVRAPTAGVAAAFEAATASAAQPPPAAAKAAALPVSTAAAPAAAKQDGAPSAQAGTAETAPSSQGAGSTTTTWEGEHTSNKLRSGSQRYILQLAAPELQPVHVSLYPRNFQMPCQKDQRIGFEVVDVRHLLAGHTPRPCDEQLCACAKP